MANAIQTASSFGLDENQVGPEFDAMGFLSSERSTELSYRENFFTCRHHDWKVFDFDGRMQKAGRVQVTQPLIGGHVPSFYVPLSQRRPHAPYRIARTIVGAFTSMLFGHGRWPTIKSEDPDTQDFANALVDEAGLKAKFIRLRNIGGSCGTAGLSWEFRDGKPRVRVHKGRHVFVLDWEDEDESIPAHVTELYQYARDVWDPKRKKRIRKLFWHRRDWTVDADVIFEPVEVQTKQNPTAWIVDEEKSHIHNDGFCHFVYVQNLPDEEVTSSDGQPDYAETYEQMGTLDLINSVGVKGGVANLDPTLVLKMNAEELGFAAVKKGSDNLLAVGPTGDAKYMELSGQSITAGKALVDQQREQILEACHCIVADPNEVVAAGTSSVALKIIYAPMLGKTDILRDQYGDALIRLLVQMTRSARVRMPDPSAETDEERYVHEIRLDDEGNEIDEPVDYYLDLPARQDKEQVYDDNGNPTGEEKAVQVERHPGKGTLSLEWGQYFKQTADDKSKESAALTTSTGGKPSLSQRTAVEIASKMYDRDGDLEWQRVTEEKQARDQVESDMFPSIGGEVEEEEQLPEGFGDDEVEEPEKPEKPKVKEADLALVMTVDEIRIQAGLPALGGSLGTLTLAEFKAKQVAKGTEAGKQVGAVEGAAEAGPDSPEDGAGDVPAPATPPTGDSGGLPGGSGGPGDGEAQG